MWKTSFKQKVNISLFLYLRYKRWPIILSFFLQIYYKFSYGKFIHKKQQRTNSVNYIFFHNLSKKKTPDFLIAVTSVRTMRIVYVSWDRITEVSWINWGNQPHCFTYAKVHKIGGKDNRKALDHVRKLHMFQL